MRIVMLSILGRDDMEFLPCGRDGVDEEAGNTDVMLQFNVVEPVVLCAVEKVGTFRQEDSEL
jgi:hypothetical protein